MHAKYEGILPEGWKGGDPVTKFWRGNMTHLYRVVRPCKLCEAEITLDVTRAALEGIKKNAGLLLRSCPACRAERKAGGPGSRGGKSRPVGGTVEQSRNAIENEMEILRTANATMRQELAGLYAQVRELHEQLGIKNNVKMPWEVG